MRILLPEEIKKAIECPELGNGHYGSWGILTAQQRLSIKNLLDVLDSADYIIKEQFEKIEKQQEEIERLKNRIANQDKEIKLMKSVNINEEIERDFISKDKIRDKIKEIHDYTFMSLEERDQQDYAMTKLEELLGE